MYRSAAGLGTLALASFMSIAQAQSIEELDNGGVNTGSISPAGNEDTYTFDGKTGDTAWLSMTDVNGRDSNAPGNVYPYLLVYDTNGDLLTRDWDTEAASVVTTLPLNGTYTVVVKDYQDSGTGPYEVRLAQAPGAQEHGRLVNGGMASENLTLGDLDTYTFDGETGDVAWLSMTDVNGRDPNVPGDVYPYLLVYGPNGDLLVRDWDTEAASVVATLPLNGTYTVVAKDYQDFGTGPYEVRLAKAPGAQEHGGLANGGLASETITLGDLDTYTFYGETGDVAWLSMTDVNGRDPNVPGDVYPYLLVYGPNGDLLVRDWDTEAASVVATLPLNGTYTVVAKDYQDFGTGPYEVRLAKAPGAREHGGLANGGLAPETITLGDLDTYVFYGSTGDTVSLSMSDVNGSDPNLPGNVYPYILLYGPSGGLVTRDWDNEVASFSTQLTSSGAYTVVAKDYQDSGTGPYTVEFTSHQSERARRLHSEVPRRQRRRPASGSFLGFRPSRHLVLRLGAGPYQCDVPLRRWYRAEATGCAGGTGERCYIIVPG